MRRIQAIAAILGAAALAVIAMRATLNKTAPAPQAPQQASPQTSGQPHDGSASNASPSGMFIDKDSLVYVNYGTADPALRSFMRALMDGSFDSTAKGQAIFLKICAACHQPDGAGKDGVAPPLAGSEWVLAPKGDRLARIILNGLSGPIQVKGRQWNLTMLPWRETLKDEEIAIVLTFIRTKVGGNKAGPITPEMVGAARKEPHPGAETEADLLKVAD